MEENRKNDKETDAEIDREKDAVRGREIGGDLLSLVLKIIHQSFFTMHTTSTSRNLYRSLQLGA